MLQSSSLPLSIGPAPVAPHLSCTEDLRTGCRAPDVGVISECIYVLSACNLYEYRYVFFVYIYIHNEFIRKHCVCNYHNVLYRHIHTHNEESCSRFSESFSFHSICSSPFYTGYWSVYNKVLKCFSKSICIKFKHQIKIIISICKIKKHTYLVLARTVCQ